MHWEILRASWLGNTLDRGCFGKMFLVLRGPELSHFGQGAASVRSHLGQGKFKTGAVWSGIV